MMISKIKQLANERGYNTPEDLSKKMGMTRTTVYNVWTGDVSRRRFSTMHAISKALDVSLEDLFEMV